MATLTVTLVDVGWGDSILVEAVDDDGGRHFGLVDCNDYETQRSSLLYVKRYLDRVEHPYGPPRHPPVFDWVVLTHGHADHARGLKRMFQTFGTRRFWYPKSVGSTTHAYLLNYASRSSRVEHHESIDTGKDLDSGSGFAPVRLRALWPDRDHVDAENENHNSVVLELTLGSVSFVLTGDAEAETWEHIAPRLPDSTRMLQVPHHGGRNGTFTPAGSTPWLDEVERIHGRAADVRLAFSSHIRPHGHPHPDVVTAVRDRQLEYHRTDRHLHLTYCTDGTDVDVTNHPTPRWDPFPPP